MKYSDLYNLRLGHLNTAVDDWSVMANQLSELAEDADTSLHRPSQEADWVGENAEVSRPFIQYVTEQFRYSYLQARSVHVLLRDLLTDMVEYRQALRMCERSAADQGLHIDAWGRVPACAFGFSRPGRLSPRDPRDRFARTPVHDADRGNPDPSH